MLLCRTAAYDISRPVQIQADHTLRTATHLKVEPQPVLWAVCVLTHIDVVLQTIVRRACEANVAAFKVTGEGEVARWGAC